MDVLGALLTVLLSSSCTAVPLKPTVSLEALSTDHQGLSLPEAGRLINTSVDGNPPAPTETTKLANDAFLQSSVHTADSATSEPHHTSTFPAFVLSTSEKSITGDPVLSTVKMIGSEDVASASKDKHSMVLETLSHLQTTTQASLKLDVLDYQLSSLKNKSADRQVTTFPGSMPSAWVTTGLPGATQKRVLKPKVEPAVGKSSVVYKAPTSPYAVGEKEATAVPRVASHNQANNEGLHVSVEGPTIKELTSQVPPTANPNVPTHNYFRVQSLTWPTAENYGITDALNITTTETMQATTVLSSTLPPWNNVDFVQTSAPTATNISVEHEYKSNEAVDVERQLESLVSTQRPTKRPSTAQSQTIQPSTTDSSFSSSADLVKITTKQNNTLNERPVSHLVTNTPQTKEGSSEGNMPLPTLSDPVNCTSVFCTAEQTPHSLMGSSDMAAAVKHSVTFQENTSQNADDGASLGTLENIESSATAVTVPEPILEFNTASLEHPEIANSSVATFPLQTNYVTLAKMTSMPPTSIPAGTSTMVNSSEASVNPQNVSDPTSMLTEHVKMSTEATDYRHEAFQTTPSEESSISTVAAITTYGSFDTMLTSPSSHHSNTFPSADDHDTLSLNYDRESTTELTPSQPMENETVMDILPAAPSTPVGSVLGTFLEDSVTNSDNSKMPNTTSAVEHEESSAGTGDTAEKPGMISGTTAAEVEGQEVLPELTHEGLPTQLLVSEPTEHFTFWKENDTAHEKLETTRALSAVTESSASSDFSHVSSDGLTSVVSEVTTTLPANPDSSEESEPVSPHTPASASDIALEVTSPHVEQSTSEKSTVSAAVPSEETTVMPRHGASEDGTSAELSTQAPAISSSEQTVKGTLPTCVPLEPPRSPTHEFRLVFNTSAEFSWEQVEALERRIQHFSNDSTCPRRFARTAFALGPPHVLSWTDPSANASWCDRDAVDFLLRSMRANTGHPTPEVTRAFYPEFKIVAIELRYRGACADRRGTTPFPVAATAIGVVLAAALVAGLVLWRALRLASPRSRKLNVTSRSSATQQQPPGNSFDLKQRRPVLLPGENRAPAGGANGTPSKSPHTKPNPPFVVDTDFCYINPNFLEVVKPSPPPPPPYRRSLDRRVRSLEAVLPAPPPRPPHGPHSTLGSRSKSQLPAEQDEGNCTSSSSGVESDAQPSGEAKSNESS
ncbi:hypothetical protein HPB49_012123 [Dermacentor silvarum]|uniref:Uncharacterized protein n=1 Tax=Dermacentor silvarum TaxID=543639 RepID=A0ACB8C999_DERSI|nr:mucin-17 [Dermacentor silvarum]KAH7937425.1 hypothetical protein HPB49_012123 [Dermacentor silvarum]